MPASDFIEFRQAKSEYVHVFQDDEIVSDTIDRIHDSYPLSSLVV
jgi:hypothetical protein